MTEEDISKKADDVAVEIFMALSVRVPIDSRQFKLLTTRLEKLIMEIKLQTINETMEKIDPSSLIENINDLQIKLAKQLRAQGISVPTLDAEKS